MAAKHRKKCNRCKAKAYREKHPVRAAYQHLKDNAKRRGKYFDLTFEQFAEFCHKTDYIQGKGRTKDCYSIDCIDPTKGYTISNIRRLTVSENASKGAKILNYDWVHGTATVQTFNNNSSGPF